MLFKEPDTTGYLGSILVSCPRGWLKTAGNLNWILFQSGTALMVEGIWGVTQTWSRSVRVTISQMTIKNKMKKIRIKEGVWYFALDPEFMVSSCWSLLIGRLYLNSESLLQAPGDWGNKYFSDSVGHSQSPVMMLSGVMEWGGPVCWRAQALSVEGARVAVLMTSLRSPGKPAHQLFSFLLSSRYWVHPFYWPDYLKKTFIYFNWKDERERDRIFHSSNLLPKWL